MASFVRSLSYVCNYVCYLQRQLCTIMYSSYVDVDFYEEHCGTITFITIPVSTSISVCTDRTMARRVNYIYSSSILVCIRGGGSIPTQKQHQHRQQYPRIRSCESICQTQISSDWCQVDMHVESFACVCLEEAVAQVLFVAMSPTDSMSHAQR